jgi:hypothetical protein
MRRRIQRISILPLIGLVLSAGVLPDVVFCSGDDGHRAFELASRACCHADSVGDDDCESREDHCTTNCSDLRFSADEMLSKSSHHELTHDGFAKPLLVDVSVLPACVTASSFQARHLTPGDPAPRQRHTTVQLC